MVMTCGCGCGGAVWDCGEYPLAHPGDVPGEVVVAENPDGVDADPVNGDVDVASGMPTQPLSTASSLVMTEGL